MSISDGPLCAPAIGAAWWCWQRLVCAARLRWVCMFVLALGALARASSRHCLRVSDSESSLCATGNGGGWGWAVAAVAPEDAMTAVKTATAAQYENRDMV